MFFTIENIPLFVSSLAFLVILLFSLGISVTIRGISQKRNILKKISATNNDWTAAEQEQTGLELSDKSSNPFAKILSTIGIKANTKKSAEDAEIKLKFLRAGIRDKNAITIFWGVKFLAVVSFPMVFLALVIGFMKDMQFNHVILGTAFMMTLGLLLPEFWLRLRTSKRKEKLFKSFPDALDLLVVCIEAGMGLDAAIRRTGEELVLGHPELSQELNHLNLELRGGKSRQTALKNLAQRTNLDDVNSLVTLLIQTDKFGTSVAQALKVFADSFRSARFQRAEEKAAKLATKLIFPLAIFIFPAFFTVALGPAAIQLYRTFIEK